MVGLGISEPSTLYVLNEGDFPDPVLTWVDGMFRPSILREIGMGSGFLGNSSDNLGCEPPTSLYITRAPMTSIFEGQNPQTRPKLPTKTRVIWVPGNYMYIHDSGQISSRPPTSFGPPFQVALWSGNGTPAIFGEIQVGEILSRW